MRCLVAELVACGRERPLPRLRDSDAARLYRSALEHALHAIQSFVQLLLQRRQQTVQPVAVLHVVAIKIQQSQNSTESRADAQQVGAAFLRDALRTATKFLELVG